MVNILSAACPIAVFLSPVVTTDIVNLPILILFFAEGVPLVTVVADGSLPK